jgi:lipoprotein-anchoring transpeptidase ErfK/SrfK
VPARAAAMALGWKIDYDPVTRLSVLNGAPVPVDQPTLHDGTLLIESSQIPGDRLRITIGAPRVVADLDSQVMFAYQGDLIVMESPISTGRARSDTPPGRYRTGKKEKMHISSIYGSKMPFSVHLKGNYFIHGSEMTQTGPGSHGCIRLPLYNNACQWFFSWVRPGTPVEVYGRRPKNHTK